MFYLNWVECLSYLQFALDVVDFDVELIHLKRGEGLTLISIMQSRISIKSPYLYTNREVPKLEMCLIWYKS